MPAERRLLYGEKQAHITSGMFMDISDADDLIDSIEDAIRADPSQFRVRPTTLVKGWVDA